MTELARPAVGALAAISESVLAGTCWRCERDHAGGYHRFDPEGTYGPGCPILLAAQAAAITAGPPPEWDWDDNGAASCSEFSGPCACARRPDD